MKIEQSKSLLDVLVNERFNNNVLGEKKIENEENNKLEEFTTMFRNMVGSQKTPVKLTADNLFEKFNMENKYQEGVDINRDLTEFIEKEIKKQSENKVEVISPIEIKKVFEMIVVKEEAVVSKIKELEVMEEIVVDLKDILQYGNNEGVRSLIDIISKDIYKEGSLEKSIENKEIRMEFDKLKDFYSSKKEIDKGFENKTYLNEIVKKLNLEEAEGIEKK